MNVLLAMSGGVDSSVAAAMLVEQGHNVVGVTMKTFCYSETNSTGKTCCGLDGILDARRVADTLGIPHYVFDMEEAFTAAVIDDFVHEYAHGRTPNPCVRCNSNTKIPDLLRRGRMLGCDVIATGHYARTRVDDHGVTRIMRGRDASKDQTYFLWGVPAEVIPHLHFPVGELTKPEVRAYARALELATADKPESQEICFVPSGDYAEFIGKRLGSTHTSLQPGAVVTSTGEVIGEHGGHARYTVGQRKGLGGGKHAPLYVIGVRAATNEIVVGSDADLYRDDVVLGDLNWLHDAPSVGARVNVQIRHRAAGVPAVVTEVGYDTVSLKLDRTQRAVTPGQSGAVFIGDELIGGGRIR
jgi:tRNA-specific 2-thiouridylase